MFWGNVKYFANPICFIKRQLPCVIEFLTTRGLGYFQVLRKSCLGDALFFHTSF